MATIYDSITNTTTLDSVSVNVTIFDSFTVEKSGRISEIQLVLSNPIGSSLNMCFVSLYENDACSPYPCPSRVTDTLLIIPDMAVIGKTPTVYDLSILLITHPEVIAGKRYWVGLSGNSFIEWGFTREEAGLGVKGEFFNTGGISFSTSNGAYQLIIGTK